MDSDRSTASSAEVEPAGSRLARFASVELFFLATVVGIVVRVWMAGDGPPALWQDSYDYITVGSHPLWSVDLWGGARPGLVSLLIARLGGELNVNYVVFQIVLAAVCWAALAAQASAVMPTVARRWVAFGTVVAFSFVRPIAIWDRSILSESLGVSLLVGTVAAGLWLLRRPGYGRLVVFVVVAAAWAGTRDTNAVVVAIVAGTLVVAWAARRRSSRRHGPRHRDRRSGPQGWLLVGAGALVVVVALSAWSSNVGSRHVVPLSHVFAARVLPFEDRLVWFTEQGMPGLGLALPTQTPETDLPVVVPVDLDAPRFEAWRSWLRTDARATLLRYAITHPDFVISEPLQDPERTFNNGDGDVVSTYGPQGSRSIPGLTALLWLPTIPTVALALGIGAFHARRRERLTPLGVVAAVCVVASAPLAVAAWHADAMETARHLLTAAVLLRLGVVLAVLSVLEVVAVGSPGSGNDAPAAQEAVPPGA